MSEEARRPTARALACFYRCCLALLMCAFALGVSAKVVPVVALPACGVESALTCSDEADPEAGAATSVVQSAEQEPESPESPEIGCVHTLAWVAPAGTRALTFSGEAEPRSFVPSPSPRPSERG